MQFNSYAFIFVFMPVVILLYYMANKIRYEFGKIVLIIASIIFYANGQINMLIVLCISIMTNYFFAILMKKAKQNNAWMIMIPVVINIGLLLYFKYTDFLFGRILNAVNMGHIASEIMLPIGISFYTFQQISYVISLYQGKIQDNDLIDYLCYILFFPKLLMGPLMEPADFITQINDKSRKIINWNNIAIGIKLFSLGLFKKVLLADTFARVIAEINSGIEAATSGESLLLMLVSIFQLYFDFSGYTDMAVGVASMLNIELPINFDSPYKAISIRDFWKRWHISLTSFLTKYIYIPLGGSKKGAFRTYINTIIVFTISGFWHGAGYKYIAWGIINGIICSFDRVIYKYEKRIFMPVRWFCTFIGFGILLLLFSASSVSEWRMIMTKLLVIQDMSIGSNVLEAFQIPEALFIVRLLHLQDVYYVMPVFNMMAFLLAAFFICLIPENNYRAKNRLSLGNMLLASVCFVWGVICLGTESSFVYFGF